MILSGVNLTQGPFKSVQRTKEAPMPPRARALASGTADTNRSQVPEGALSSSLDQVIFSRPASSLVPTQCSSGGGARHGAGAVRMRSGRQGFCRPQRRHEEFCGVWGGPSRWAAQAGTVCPLRLAGGRKVNLRACSGPPAAAGARLGRGRPLLRRSAAPRAPGPRWHTASGQHRVGGAGRCADSAQAVGLWVVDPEPPWILIQQC